MRVVVIGCRDNGDVDLDELRAKIVGLVQAPATKVVQIVQAPAGQLARVFGAYAAKDAA